MRCFACDCELSDYEATLRSAVTNQYLDMCTTCIHASEITTISRTSTNKEEKEMEFDLE